jgi:hypothetical protein
LIPSPLSNITQTFTPPCCAYGEKEHCSVLVLANHKPAPENTTHDATLCIVTVSVPSKMLQKVCKFLDNRDGYVHWPEGTLFRNPFCLGHPQGPLSLHDNGGFGSLFVSEKIFFIHSLMPRAWFPHLTTQ